MKVFYLVGIPGSGKSHFASELAKKEKAIIVSSDAIRKELFGDSEKQKKTNMVYRTLYERVNKMVLEGNNVIIDATNIERERRMFSLHKLDRLKLPNLEKICYYFDTPYEKAVERNALRSRVVESRILEKMRNNMEIPLIGEGFDAVHIIHDKSPYLVGKEQFVELVESGANYQTLFEGLQAIPMFRDIYQFDQENVHHQFLLCEHTYYVYEYVNEYYEGEDKFVLQVAALFHDVGKPTCKKYKQVRQTYAYFGHENVSTQMACHFLYELGFEEAFIQQVLDIIQLHMLISFGGDRGASEIYHLIGGEQLTNLYFFREADRFAK